MSLGFSFFLDVGVVLLLSSTIYLCMKLNRQLQSIRDSKSEMAELIKHFGEATEKAQESIGELKATTKRLSDTLEARIGKANYAADDLAYMIEKANKFAGGIESSINARRADPTRKNESAVGKTVKGAEALAKKTISPAEEKASPSTGTSNKESKSQAEKELLEALKTIR